ncbi:hypothetical protein ACFLV7_08565 [Chloroflexota bacterium]
MLVLEVGEPEFAMFMITQAIKGHNNAVLIAGSAGGDEQELAEGV